MKKIDFKKELKYLYKPSAKEVVQVEVSTMNFLMIGGEGDPGSAPAHAAGGSMVGEGGFEPPRLFRH